MTSAWKVAIEAGYVKITRTDTLQYLSPGEAAKVTFDRNTSTLVFPTGLRLYFDDASEGFQAYDEITSAAKTAKKIAGDEARKLKRRRDATPRPDKTDLVLGVASQTIHDAVERYKDTSKKHGWKFKEWDLPTNSPPARELAVGLYGGHEYYESPPSRYDSARYGCKWLTSDPTEKIIEKLSKAADAFESGLAERARQNAESEANRQKWIAEAATKP